MLDVMTESTCQHDNIAEAALSNNTLPNHVVVVMDGNGRWAKQQGLSRSQGHRAGADTAHEIIEHCAKLHLPALSLFAFSSENWLRPYTEVNFLMSLFHNTLTKQLTLLHNQGIKIKFVGLKHNLSAKLCQLMDKAETLTAHNGGMTLNIAFNYGGQRDIIEAAKLLATKVKAGEIQPEDINEQRFSEALSLHGLPAPDLFIRTSGEYRLSNFFLWQLAYTELYFTDIFWPDFNARELEKALQWFSQRKRRFGSLNNQ